MQVAFVDQVQVPSNVPAVKATSVLEVAVVEPEVLVDLVDQV